MNAGKARVPLMWPGYNYGRRQHDIVNLERTYDFCGVIPEETALINGAHARLVHVAHTAVICISTTCQFVGETLFAFCNAVFAIFIKHVRSISCIRMFTFITSRSNQRKRQGSMSVINLMISCALQDLQKSRSDANHLKGLKGD